MKADRLLDFVLSRALVLFDAGFTLVEPIRPVADTYLAIARDLVGEMDEPAFRQHLRERWGDLARFRGSADLRTSEAGERDAWRRFTAAVARPFPALAARQDDWLDRLFAVFDAPTAWRPVAGVVTLLEELDRVGARCAVVSNWHGALHGILRGLDLERFEFVLTSAEVGRRKPHPEPFLEALSRAGIAADCACHLGDSWEDDVVGARAAGIEPVLVSLSPPPAPVRATTDLVALVTG